MIYKDISKTNENNASLHVQRYSRQQPIQIDLKQRREYGQTLKTVRSHSKLKDAIIKDNKMKFRSKAQSVNRIKGKLKIPPKLTIFKKKIKTSLARNARHGSYAQINHGTHKQSLHSYLLDPWRMTNQSSYWVIEIISLWENGKTLNQIYRIISISWVRQWVTSI